MPAASPTTTERTVTPATALRTIDVDVHHHIADWAAVAKHVPAGLRWRFRPAPPLARHGFWKLGDEFGPVPRPALDGGKLGHPAASPQWVKEHYLDQRGVDLAVLTGPLLSLGVQPSPDVASTTASAVNDWTLENWVRPFDCFKGSILIAHQDTAGAVAEIDRLGDDPGMVQVLLSSASETPLGRRMYHPIYEACVRHGLPIALHIGGEGAGNSPAATPVGHPSTYFEWYSALPQSYMAHITSMVTEGVFVRFPTLKVLLYEGGIFWFPHLMWRFDKNWKAQRSEAPWVSEPPSVTMLRHFRLASAPLEAAPPAALLQTLEMIDAEHTLLFSSNYPQWEYGNPFDMVAGIPDQLRRRIAVDNALDFYGDRLLRAST